MILLTHLANDMVGHHRLLCSATSYGDLRSRVIAIPCSDSLFHVVAASFLPFLRPVFHIDSLFVKSFPQTTQGDGRQGFRYCGHRIFCQ